MYPVLGMLFTVLLLVLAFGGVWLSTKRKKYEHGGVVPQRTWSYPYGVDIRSCNVIALERSGDKVYLFTYKDPISPDKIQILRDALDKHNVRHVIMCGYPLPDVTAVEENRATGRQHCPPLNIGHVFGAIGIEDMMEGYVDSPDYCIVTPAGHCRRHDVVMVNAQVKYDGTTKS